MTHDAILVLTFFFFLLKLRDLLEVSLSIAKKLIILINHNYF